MKKTYRQIYDLLTPIERRRAVILLGMILVMAMLDMVGVASIMPFIAVLANPEVVEQNRFLAFTFEGLGFPSTNSFLFFLGLVFFVLLVTSLAFKALTTYALLNFTHMRNFSVGKRLVEGYLNQPYEWFLNKHSAELSKSILSEVQQVIQGAIIPAVQLISQSAVVIALTLLLILVDPLLALVVAVGLGCAYSVIYFILRRYLNRIGTERTTANKERFRIVQDTFGAIKEMKLVGLETIMMKRFEKPARIFAKSQAASQVVARVPRFAFEAVAFGGILILLLTLLRTEGGIREAIPTLSLYAFAGYRLMPALQEVFHQATQVRYNEKALSDLHDDLRNLSMPRESVTTELRKPDPIPLRKCIQLVGITYCYPNAEDATLKDVSIEIPARSTVAIIGKTGCGKTTLVDLILGLLQNAQHGQVLVDGVSITPENVRRWQRSVGYVPQRIHLIDDTIKANIAFGVSEESIDMKAVEHAARQAHIHDFIVTELSEQYNTMVGEGGVRLSGGQCQRIGIARALYRNPELLVFDEATSALDSETEGNVMDAIYQLGGTRTLILIAHRLSTVKRCDRLYCMDHGRVIKTDRYAGE